MDYRSQAVYVLMSVFIFHFGMSNSQKCEERIEEWNGCKISHISSSEGCYVQNHSDTTQFTFYIKPTISFEELVIREWPGHFYTHTLEHYNFLNHDKWYRIQYWRNDTNHQVLVNDFVWHNYNFFANITLIDIWVKGSLVYSECNPEAMLPSSPTCHNKLPTEFFKSNSSIYPDNAEEDMVHFIASWPVVTHALLATSIVLLLM
ncbi:hypothetical protein SK128_016025 [Halocaridina rubra]|uniref:Uncharacterized protein n=1 Tax=Halocaridina rubra TaxID=373956 RepID=A0AAN8X6P9_HALRR